MKRVKVTNDFRFKTADGRLTLTRTKCVCFTRPWRAQHVLDISELREELLRLFNSR
jgi:hypothetical protein